MSNIISNFYQNTQLSFAAYAALSADMDSEQYGLALETAGMSEQQATDFVNVYEIIDQLRL